MAQGVLAGRYRLDEPLGGGAMGSVWLAEDAELGRRVAVKLLGPDADRARFDREARAAASLAHPNICQLFDYGEEDGRPYMVLEYLPGGSLDDLIERGTALPDPETARIAEQIAEGLAHAHSRGLVHRDLKPANILFDAEGHAKIADFGIARMRGTSTLTDAGTVLAPRPTSRPSRPRRSGDARERRLLGRRDALSDAHGATPVRVAERDGARCDAPRRRAAFRLRDPARRACAARERRRTSLAKHPADRPQDGAALLAELRAAGTLGGTATMVALPHRRADAGHPPGAAAAHTLALDRSAGAAHRRRSARRRVTLALAIDGTATRATRRRASPLRPTRSPRSRPRQSRPRRRPRQSPRRPRRRRPRPRRRRPRFPLRRRRPSPRPRRRRGPDHCATDDHRSTPPTTTDTAPATTDTHGADPMTAGSP